MPYSERYDLRWYSENGRLLETATDLILAEKAAYELACRYRIPVCIVKVKERVIKTAYWTDARPTWTDAPIDLADLDIES